jgi:hypothetical protein
VYDHFLQNKEISRKLKRASGTVEGGSQRIFLSQSSIVGDSNGNLLNERPSKLQTSHQVSMFGQQSDSSN